MKEGHLDPVRAGIAGVKASAYNHIEGGVSASLEENQGSPRRFVPGQPRHEGFR